MPGRPRKRAAQLTKLHEEATRLAQAVFAACPVTYRRTEDLCHPCDDEAEFIHLIAANVYFDGVEFGDCDSDMGRWNTAIEAACHAVVALEDVANKARSKIGLPPLNYFLDELNNARARNGAQPLARLPHEDADFAAEA